MTCSAARNGASSSTYITASAKNEATSASAPTTGLWWRTTTSAKMTAIAAKKKKMANSNITVVGLLGCWVVQLLGLPKTQHYVVGLLGCSVVGLPKNPATQQPNNSTTQQLFSYPMLRYEESHDHDIHDSQRQKHIPAEAHEDVVLEAGNRPADPDEDEQQGRPLRREEEHRQQRRPPHPRLVPVRDVPAAEVERDGQRGDRGHRHVLGHEEERELHRRILGVVSGDQLRLRFREIERQAVRLRECRDDEDDETEPHRRREDVPRRQLDHIK